MKHNEADDFLKGYNASVEEMAEELVNEVEMYLNDLEVEK